MFVPPRYAALLAVALLISLAAFASRAHAQSCHAIAPADGRLEQERPFRASFGLLAASYGRNDEQRGNYQGLYAGFGYRQPWWGVELWLPAYRLADGADTSMGLGDLTLSARGTLLRAYDDQVTLGVLLPVMLPTGDEQKSLGTGHVMPMPALWFRLDVEPFALQLELGYGRAIGRGNHAQHDDHAHQGAARSRQAPLVNPMNRAELEHALTLELGVQRHLRVHARWFGALPVQFAGRSARSRARAETGLARQIVAAGATLNFDALDFTTELQTPVYGDPFDVKLLFQLALVF